MEFFSSPDLWIALVTLLLREIVLGVDNVVFISILADKLPPEQRRKARILGLSLAVFPDRTAVRSLMDCRPH
jgi:predicted tellurium resistance membrane protein TerC